MEAEELVRADPEFRAAMARRGITDFDAIQVDAWPAGHFGPSPRTTAGGWAARSRSSSRSPATANGPTRSTA